MRLNHLMLTVRNLGESRDWYVSKLGLKVEFEVPEKRFAALEDDSGFGLRETTEFPRGQSAATQAARVVG
jgi:catechol 2,3-dioxygenase-like lactoylglutathione lyase family enzyme